MVQPKRIAITTAIGILTGAYCVGTLFIAAPGGVSPEPWFMAMIFSSRAVQGLVIGFADTIPFHWAVRGGGIGALMSIQLCFLPLSAQNYSGASLLLLAGILYGILADGIACRVLRADAKTAA